MFGHLFYSRNCKSCGDFIRIINQEGIINGFNMISIDDLSAQQITNLSIKFVPTVIVRDQNGSNIFEAGKAFEWVNNLIQFRRQNMAKMVEMQRRRIIQANINAGVTGVGMEHSPMETSGISDDFSYLVTDHAQPKSFMPYGHDDQYKIVTLKNLDESRLSEGEQKQRISNYEKSRTMQNATIEQYIENQLRDTICNNLSNGN